MGSIAKRLWVTAAVFAIVAVLFLLIDRGGSDAPVSRSAAKFCAQLGEIKAMNESPPSLPDPTHGKAGLAKLSEMYDQLERVAPTAQVAQWVAEARPLLGQGGVVAFTPAVEKAIPPAQRLRSAVQRQCGLEVPDVFKIGFP